MDLKITDDIGEEFTGSLTTSFYGMKELIAPSILGAWGEDNNGNLVRKSSGI
jgi:hypothetical protein